MKMKLNHLLNEVTGDGSRMFYRKIPNIPIHVMIGDGVTHVFIRFKFENEYSLPTLSCKGITSKTDINTFTLISSFRDSDLLLSLAADLLQPNQQSLFENYQEEKYVVWLRHQLLRWVSYYKSTSNEVMSKEIQLGLLGELKKLINYLKDGKSLSCWRGPFGDHHDFHCVNHHSEVKSRLVTSKELIKVNGTEQLHHDGKLFLVVLHFIEHNDGETIYNLVDQIIPLLSAEDIEEFYELLSYVGELPSEEKTYSFTLLLEETYMVQKGFPRQPLVEGTLDVTYKIPLKTIKNFLIKRIDLEMDTNFNQLFTG
ncbi:PD-(D/E)XK motif protein [Solibacillus sp. FSL R7-0668]|uniref:PD-(D/E)XK motif protein n=1 Tax=Solibacillus sp. FSL R7-0668 TaxID=2921688 RepID=UPI0030FCF9AC